MQIVQDKDVFTAKASIKIGRNIQPVQVRPYVGEVTGELRGKSVSRWFTTII